MTNSEQEKTFRIALYALKSNPAYLTLFCLGLMGGPVVAVAIFRTDKTIAIIATISWMLFLLASIFVVAFVESRSLQSHESFFEPIDQMAKITFLNSQSAEKLSGRWQLFWYKGIGSNRKPYDPLPKDIVNISTKGSKLLIQTFDPSTGLDWYLFGRLSEKSDISLIYWSKPKNEMLTGVVFLTVNYSFEAKGEIMTGYWYGRTRDNKITNGEIELIRPGHKSKGISLKY